METMNGDVETESSRNGASGHKVWRLVLTGGPCGGKTTAQITLSTIFESMGWRVFRVPETATILLGGGVSFSLLDDEQRLDFQENLLKTMFQLEDTYFSLASTQKRNCLVICDRGAMDASAYLPREDWEEILDKNSLNEVDIRDNRYDQVVHLVSAAIGAEDHYTRSNNKTRTEDIELAQTNDRLVGEAWVGHPYYDRIDNSTDFETKMRRLCRAVTARLHIPHAEELLNSDSKKKKFLVECESLEPTIEKPWPRFRDFQVHHDYLPCFPNGPQARIRRRGRHGKWMYTHTVRKEVAGEMVETRTNVSRQIYDQLLAQADRESNVTIEKTRRCFVWQNQIWQLDIYSTPHPGLMLLETYSALPTDQLTMPDFLTIKREVTGEPSYSMFNLSKTTKLSNGIHEVTVGINGLNPEHD